MKLICFTVTLIALLFSNVGNQINPMTRDYSYKNREMSFNRVLEKSPPCIQAYYYTKYYCKIYNVPEKFAFRILYLETGYTGPNDIDYNPAQTSSANALGAYQLLFSTAKDMHDDYFVLTKKILLNDVKLNTKLGIKYMAWLYNLRSDWKYVAGFYNTGYWKVNDYAKYASS